MKNPKIIVSGLIAVLVLGGAGVLAFQDNESSNNASTTSEPTSEVMEKNDDDSQAHSDEVMEKDESEVMEKDESSSVNSSRFVTLSDFESNQQTYDDNTKVLFFHASWCSICAGIEKEINADPNRIPSGTTLIKTDYDTQTELRQKYGVTTQYTFVQIDNDGNLIAKWSATSLSKALASIQS